MTKRNKNIIQPLQELLTEADELLRSRTMAFPEVDRKLSGDQLEEFLESAAEEIRLRSKVQDRGSVKLGHTLFSVKQRLPMGGFKGWVEKYCPFCYKTAQNYISLYRATLDRPELLNLKKSIVYLIGSNNFPEALRDHLCENLIGFYDLKWKDVLKLHTDYLNGDINLDDDSITRHLKTKEQDEMHQLLEARLQHTITKLENEKKPYQSQIDRQKKIGAAPYDNKPKEIMRTGIAILDRAVSDFRSLKLYGALENQDKTQPKKIGKIAQKGPLFPDPPDHVFDQIKKWEFEQLGPDDFIQKGIPDDLAEELRLKEEQKELAPDDLTPRDPLDDIEKKEDVRQIIYGRLNNGMGLTS